MQTNLSNVYDWENNNVADTSIETFNAIRDDLVNDREQVLDAIKTLGHITLKELCVHLNRHPNDISGRITELLHGGFVVVVGKKYLPNSRGRMTSNRVYEAVL